VDEVKSGSEGLQKLVEAAVHLNLHASTDEGHVTGTDSMSATSEMTASDSTDHDHVTVGQCTSNHTNVTQELNSVL